MAPQRGQAIDTLVKVVGRPAVPKRLAAAPDASGGVHAGAGIRNFLTEAAASFGGAFLIGTEAAEPGSPPCNDAEFSSWWREAKGAKLMPAKALGV
jgi:hypothetical protein